MCWLRCLGMMLLVYPAMGGIAAPAVGEDQVVSTTEAAPATASIETRRTVLEQRVAARWDALIHRDFAAVYSFASPGYRKLYSREAFESGFGKQVVWRRVKVVNIDFKSDDAAVVGINVYFVYHPPQSEQVLDMQTYIQESWVLVDGQWWYLVKS